MAWGCEHIGTAAAVIEGCQPESIWPKLLSTLAGWGADRKVSKRGRKSVLAKNCSAKRRAKRTHEARGMSSDFREN
jgi:hypothetical protein